MSIHFIIEKVIISKKISNIFYVGTIFTKIITHKISMYWKPVSYDIHNCHTICYFYVYVLLLLYLIKIKILFNSYYTINALYFGLPRYKYNKSFTIYNQ